MYILSYFKWQNISLRTAVVLSVVCVCVCVCVCVHVCCYCTKLHCGSISACVLLLQETALRKHQCVCMCAVIAGNCTVEASVQIWKLCTRTASVLTVGWRTWCYFQFPVSRDLLTQIMPTLKLASTGELYSTSLSIRSLNCRLVFH